MIFSWPLEDITKKVFKKLINNKDIFIEVLGQ